MGWDGQDLNAVEQRFAEFAEDVCYLKSLRERRDILAEEDGGSLGDSPGRELTEEFLDSEIRRYSLRISPVEKLLLFLQKSDPEMARFFHLRYVEKRKREYIRGVLGLTERLQRNMRKELLHKGARFIGSPFIERKPVESLRERDSGVFFPRKKVLKTSSKGPQKVLKRS